jgi:transmembrane sensor
MSAQPQPRPSDAESIEATAAAWLAARDDGLTAEQADAFAAWRAADPRHEAAALRLELTWAALQQLRGFRPEAKRHPDRDLLRGSPLRKGRRIAFPLATMAAIAASLMVAVVWWVSAVRSDATETYATTTDGYQRVTLRDGSVMELNGGTAVQVKFTAPERRVRLLRGEAHFTVAKNPTRPFSVEAGSVAVRAVGTAFNVRLGAADVEVLVTQGKVSVSEVERVGSTAVPQLESLRTDRSPPVSVLLQANERTLIPVLRPATLPVAPPSLVVERIKPEVVREALAWQGPRIVFLDTPLAEAIGQFNRRNHLQLELVDEELAVLPIGGSFRAENVDAFVRLLESGGDVAAERVGSNRIILRKAK